jgi:dienelactone hydrolase
MTGKHLARLALKMAISPLVKILSPQHDRVMMTDDPLDDFEPRPLTFDGVTKIVHVAGTGPAVIVMPEMPGISPHVARFTRWIRDAGFTTYLPSLFGRDGAVPMVEEGLAVFRRACVSAEFRAFAADESSPITTWLRSLARHAHGECGGLGVGAVGMCFTGNFALSMMLESAVLAPVLSQPSLPLDNPAGIQIAPDEVLSVRERLESEDLTVLAFRFEGDRFCTAQRFAAYAEALGDRFVPRVLPTSAANPRTTPFFEQVVASPHSVVTAHLIDEVGQPTIAARDEIISFFTQSLPSTSGAQQKHSSPAARQVNSTDDATGRF